MCSIVLFEHFTSPPLLFLIVKHAETQSSSEDLTTDIDKGKIFLQDPSLCRTNYYEFIATLLELCFWKQRKVTEML